MFISAFTKNFHLFPYWARSIQSMQITKPHVLPFRPPSPVFYGTQTFITTYTRNRHLSVFWVTAIQSVPLSYFLKIHFNIILPSRTRSSKRSLNPRSRHLNQVYAFAFSHTCYMPCPSHSSLFDHANNICWGIQSMKLLVTYSSPVCCYFVALRSKYLPEYPIFQHPQRCTYFQKKKKT